MGEHESLIQRLWFVFMLRRSKDLVDCNRRVCGLQSYNGCFSLMYILGIMNMILDKKTRSRDDGFLPLMLVTNVRYAECFDFLYNNNIRLNRSKHLRLT